MTGVTKSLESILNILQSRGIVRRSVISHSLQTHTNLASTYGDASRLPTASGPESPRMDIARRRTLDVERERDDSFKRAQRSPMDEGSRLLESTPSPTLRERRRRSIVSDVTTTIQAHSSVSQSPSSGYFPSPMQAPLPSARAFSTSSSLGNPTLPPISPSSQQPSQAALITHLSDLQHQVGTKSLALQTLQAEHNHLLSAYSRSQTRCGTLEKKFQVSDAEINNLTEERNRLQAQCDAFEKQVEDLLEQRDAAHKLSIANGGQYTSILQQASRLEAQSSSDRKKWKAEKDEWERVKEDMERRIKQLESEKAEGPINSEEPHVPEGNSEIIFHKSESPSAGGSPEHRTDILKLTVVAGDIILSTNPDDLRHEIIRLRHKANDLERTLQELKTEGQRIDQMLNGIGAISKRVFAKAEAATTSTTTPGSASTTGDSTQQ
ncbi:hypothetical protein GP486_008298 [Trichoglossum hirsutum]|uniref:Uncharacterized protein n=1 Tax=Trichoglossum hirsutum TaxID=265104 RepID=A0A9P8IH79_9PEZI|nr:hypothetical protein GP486_008298 [Trichoglossum hirsutum]